MRIQTRLLLTISDDDLTQRMSLTELIDVGTLWGVFRSRGSNVTLGTAARNIGSFSL